MDARSQELCLLLGAHQAAADVDAGPPYMPQVAYHGGPVISNVKVVTVNWGPQVWSGVRTQLGPFYRSLLGGPWYQALAEYSTVGLGGTHQTIGPGMYLGEFTIAPVNTSARLSDFDIGEELRAQIEAHALPSIELDAQGFVDTIYMVEFPPGIVVSEFLLGDLCTGSPLSAVAYHSAVTITDAMGVHQVPFSVMPDMSPGGSCDLAAIDPSRTPFQKSTKYHAHELAEAVSDPIVGGSWIAPGFEGEIGDLCVLDDVEIDGYVVQRIWSVANGGCASAPPRCTDGGCPLCGLQSPCAGQEGLCEPNLQVCVGCVSDPDCAGSSPICDPALHSCRACMDSLDCATGRCIVDGGDVRAGQCVECERDADCGTGRCDLVTDRCTCTSNAECTNPTPTCGADHACHACASGADCALSPTGPVCVAGECFQCAFDGGCMDPARPFCRPWLNACTAGCNQHSECSRPTPVCGDNHICSPGCVTSADCLDPAKSTCREDHVCVGCEADTDCKVRGQRKCFNETCTAGCLSDDDCPGSAKPHCDTLTMVCVGCTAHSQCVVPGRTICGLAQVCVAGCLEDQGCPMSLPVCSPYTHTCGPRISVDAGHLAVDAGQVSPDAGPATTSAGGCGATTGLSLGGLMAAGLLGRRPRRLVTLTRYGGCRPTA